MNFTHTHIGGIDLGGTTWTITNAEPCEGDRVRIREGYQRAGEVGTYVGKCPENADKVVVEFVDKVFWETDYDGGTSMLRAAIEPYPYTREERIERAIEDYYELIGGVEGCSTVAEMKAALFAILEAGV